MDAAATALSSVRFFPFFYLLVGGEARKQKLNLHPAQPPSSLVTPPTSTANTDPQPPLQRRRCSSSSKKRGRRRRGEKRGLPPTNPADRRRPLSALGAAPDDRADARGQAPVHGTSQRRAPGEDAVEDGEERRAAARAQGGQSGAAEKQGRRDRDCDCCCCRCRRAREAKRRNNDSSPRPHSSPRAPPLLPLLPLLLMILLLLRSRERPPTARRGPWRREGPCGSGRAAFSPSSSTLRRSCAPRSPPRSAAASSITVSCPRCWCRVFSMSMPAALRAGQIAEIAESRIFKC